MPPLPLKELLLLCSIESSILLEANIRSLSECWVHQPDAKFLSAIRAAGHFGSQTVFHVHAFEESAFRHTETARCVCFLHV